MSSNKKAMSARKMLEGLVIFLGVTSASVGFYRHAQHVNRICKENKALRQYSAEAQNFVMNIKPDLLDNFKYCNDTNCMTCKSIIRGNKKALTEYNEALNTLHIDPKTLGILQQGPAR